MFSLLATVCGVYFENKEMKYIVLIALVIFLVLDFRETFSIESGVIGYTSGRRCVSIINMTDTILLPI
jgi:hypothetical protein